jgi:putative MATE family efflux protein
MESSHVHDLTKGNILKQLWSLAWPMMLSMFFYTLYSIVDTFWVGKLSVESIAAVSISQIVLFVMISLSMGIAIGSGVAMSMHIGAKDTPSAERVLAQSFVLSALSALLFTTISLIFRDQLLTISGAVGNIYEPAQAYFTITSAGSVLFFILMNVMFAFNAEGDTLTVTKLFLVSTLVNVVLDPLLIFGGGGLPALGIQGAAYATLISQAVFIILGLRILSREKRRVRFDFRKLSIEWESVKKILKIGVPASLTQVINPVGLAVLISLVAATFLEPGATAFSLIFRLEFFAYLPAAGFGIAAMAMIGQSVGAGDTARANNVFRKAILLGFTSATGLGLLLMIFGKSIIGVFTQDPQVLRYAMLYLWIVAGSYGFLSANMIISSTFQAMGRSWPGFWLFFTKFFVVTIPLSYLAVHFYAESISYIWLAIAAGNVLVAIIGFVWKQRSMREQLA